MEKEKEEVLECVNKIKEYCKNTKLCVNCMFHDDGGCTMNYPLSMWKSLKPVLRDEQKQFLSLLDKKWKFISKDKNDEVWAHEFKPKKDDCSFDSNFGDAKDLEDIFPEDMFDYLSWEDKEASLIEDLLK